MRSFVIYLPNYTKSVDMANVVIESGKQHGWDLELFEGVDGATVSVDQLYEDWGIKINPLSRKCQRQLTDRPGVRGCFLSHWLLWNKCVEIDDTIGIFEHDVIFLKSPLIEQEFTDVLKLVEGFEERRSMPAGIWYEGTRGYLITPAGAKKLIEWTYNNGCLPSDIAIGKDVVSIELNLENYVKLSFEPESKNDKHINSFTWNLEGMK